MAEAPILFWGWSAAASFGTTFAAQYPERTIGFVRYHTNRRGLPLDMGRVRDIPALLIAGAKDETAGVEDTEQLWRLGRTSGAPWTFAIEPEATHSAPEIHESTLRELTIPWMAAVLDQRLRAPAGLAGDSGNRGWWGDLNTFDISPSIAGQAVDKSWLPDERSALGWRLTVSGSA
jgi:hypothetical protein